MLALQKRKGKRGRKLKSKPLSKLINVTCQTEASTTYLQYNQIYCDCRKRDNAMNRKQISKIIRKYFAEEWSSKHRKCSLLRYIKRKQKHTNVSKTKSDNSVIYVGTKKLKSKKAVRNLSGKSVIYIGTTYNTLETPQHNDIIDLTQAEPALRVRKENAARTSLEKPYMFHKCFPKTTTKYCKKPLFNSISDSVLVVKPKTLSDWERKNTKSEHSVHLHKKLKPDLIETDRNMCLKELMSIKLPSLSTIKEIIDAIPIEHENTVSNIVDTSQSLEAVELILSSVLDKAIIQNDTARVNETTNEAITKEIHPDGSIEHSYNIPAVIVNAVSIQENLDDSRIISDESNLSQQTMSQDNVECTLVDMIEGIRAALSGSPEKLEM